MMEEEEEEVVAGASAEDKSRRSSAKGPSEPAHPGERQGEMGRGRAGLRRGRTLGKGLALLFLSTPQMPG